MLGGSGGAEQGADAPEPIAMYIVSLCAGSDSVISVPSVGTNIMCPNLPERSASEDTENIASSVPPAASTYAFIDC